MGVERMMLIAVQEEALERAFKRSSSLQDHVEAAIDPRMQARLYQLSYIVTFDRKDRNAAISSERLGGHAPLDRVAYGAEPSWCVAYARQARERRAEGAFLFLRSYSQGNLRPKNRAVGDTK